MPLKIHRVTGYDEHQNLLNSLLDKLVICWYVGAKTAEGQSWCGDCRESEPVINDYLKSMKIKNNEEVHIIYTEIEKEYFKSQDCDFRTDPKIKLEKVPTLLFLKEMRTLVEEDCKDKALLDLFFEGVREG